tara:strand:- start:169 stop:636 length:468 start_codon:yes stop_codon:yes gene_type:complete
MKKKIFDEEIYEDLDIYINVKKNLNIINENVIHQIYSLKINLNKEQKKLNEINIEINLLKTNFIIDTKDWSLEDSCNKNILKTKINNIYKTFDTICQLNYKKEDINKNITTINNTIDTLIQNNTNKYNQKHFNNDNDDETNDETNDEEMNFIINC